MIQQSELGSSHLVHPLSSRSMRSFIWPDSVWITVALADVVPLILYCLSYSLLAAVVVEDGGGSGANNKKTRKIMQNQPILQAQHLEYQVENVPLNVAKPAPFRDPIPEHEKRFGLSKKPPF